MFRAVCNLKALRLDPDYNVPARGERPYDTGARCGGRVFTDPAEYEAHMTGFHGRKPYSPPTLRPYAHTAPAVPSEETRARNLSKLAEKYPDHLL